MKITCSSVALPHSVGSIGIFQATLWGLIRINIAEYSEKQSFNIFAYTVMIIQINAD